MNKVLASIAELFTTQPAVAERLESVLVRNSDTIMIKKIVENTELREFESLFNERIKLKATREVKWLYKVDLSPGDRWLYHPSGYLKILAMNRTSTYKVKQVDEFNLLMGIQNNDFQRN